MKRALIATVVAVGAFAAIAPAARAQTPAATYTSIATLSDSRPFTLGWSFNVSSSTTVTNLGVWDGGTLGDYLAGIWDIGGTLITSQTVFGTDPSSAGFRWASIAPVVLGPGDYVVGAEFRSGLFPSFATGVTTIPTISWGSDRQLFGNGLNFPTVDTNGGYGQNGILWANFATDGTVVPEPSTWALMLVGLAAVGVASRRRRVSSQSM